MEKKNMKFVTVNTFIQFGGASYEIVEKFQRLIQSKIIDVNDIKLITINYDKNENNVESGPVHIYFASGVEIWLNLTAGYNGSGPYDLCKILKMCHLHFDENDILSSKTNEVKKRYIRKDYNCYQFKKMDGSYEYSM